MNKVVYSFYDNNFSDNWALLTIVFENGTVRILKVSKDGITVVESCK